VFPSVSGLLRPLPAASPQRKITQNDDLLYHIPKKSDSALNVRAADGRHRLPYGTEHAFFRLSALVDDDWKERKDPIPAAGWGIFKGI
jgi:hypothetical protein